MATGIELRPIFTSDQYSRVLTKVISVLKGYTPETESQLKRLCLCYHRDGSIKIEEQPCKISLLDYCLMALYDYSKESYTDNIFVNSLRYEKIIEFVDNLKAESPFDILMARRYYVDKKEFSHWTYDNSITDHLVKESLDREKWWKTFAEYRERIEYLIYRVSDAYGWTHQFRGVFTDRVMRLSLDIEDYLPERLDFYKKMCEGFEESILKEGGLNACSEYIKNKSNQIDRYFREYYTGHENLFSDSEIEELKIFAAAVYSAFTFWSY